MKGNDDPTTTDLMAMPTGSRVRLGFSVFADENDGHDCHGHGTHVAGEAHPVTRCGMLAMEMITGLQLLVLYTP